MGRAVELAHVTVSPAGKLGSATVALGGWSAMSHPDLLRMPDGSLRAFFGGIRSTAPGETNSAMNTATAPASGASWTLQLGKAAQSTSACDELCRSRSREGRHTDLELGDDVRARFPLRREPRGSRPRDPAEQLLPVPPRRHGRRFQWPGVGRLHFERDGDAGGVRQRDRPRWARGRRKLAPGSTQGKSFVQEIGRTPIAGRIGAAGVFLAFGQRYPTFKTIAVWRVDRGRGIGGAARPVRERRTRAVAPADPAEAAADRVDEQGGLGPNDHVPGSGRRRPGRGRDGEGGRKDADHCRERNCEPEAGHAGARACDGVESRLRVGVRARPLTPFHALRAREG